MTLPSHLLPTAPVASYAQLPFGSPGSELINVIHSFIHSLVHSSPNMVASSLVPGSRDKRNKVYPGQTIHTISLKPESNLNWDEKELRTEMGLRIMKLGEDLVFSIGVSRELLRLEQRSVP